LVPQVPHTPWVAGLPFFIVMALAFLISFLERRFYFNEDDVVYYQLLLLFYFSFFCCQEGYHQSFTV